MASTDATMEYQYSKQQVILTSVDDWNLWLKIRMDTARKLAIEDYVDPDKEEAELLKVVNPNEPLLTSYKADATSLGQLDSTQAANYRWDYDRWERNVIANRNIKKALAAMSAEINTTIDKRHHYLTDDCKTPYAQFTALKAALAPTTKRHKRVLIQRFNALKNGPRSNKLLEQWFSEWIDVTNQGKKMGLADTAEERPQEEFLLALKKVDYDYATGLLRDFYPKTEEEESNIPTLEKYVNSARLYLQANNPKFKAVLGSYATELDIANPVNSSQGNRGRGGGRGRGGQNNTSSGRLPVPLCLYGERHWYSDCFYINKDAKNRPHLF